MRPLSILLQQYFSALGTIVPKSFTGAFSSNSRPWCSWSLSRICKGVIKLFWNEVFMVRNTVSWCLAIICRKWSAFDMKFHLIVVLLFLKTCVKDYGDRGLVISYRKGVQLVQCKICHAWFLLTPPPCNTPLSSSMHETKSMYLHVSSHHVQLIDILFKGTWNLDLSCSSPRPYCVDNCINCRIACCRQIFQWRLRIYTLWPTYIGKQCENGSRY